MTTRGDSPSALVPAARPAPIDADDAEFGRILSHGSALGIAVAYVLSVLIALPGAGAPMAFAIAAVPAIFAGPWVGTTALLLQRARRLELSDHAAAEPVALAAPRASSFDPPVGHAA